MKRGLSTDFQQVSAPERHRSPAITQPFSIRLSPAQRKALEEAAGSTPLGTYARHKLLGTALPRNGRRGAADAALLGQILGLLGRSGSLTGLAELGSSARSGIIALTPELAAKVASACADIREVRRLLLKALGLTTGAA